jgi:hypothetical protein
MKHFPLIFLVSSSFTLNGIKITKTPQSFLFINYRKDYSLYNPVDFGDHKKNIV